MPNSSPADRHTDIEEIANAGIVDNDLEEAKKLASDNDIVHRKIQLWANNEENEYAIRLLLDGDPQYETREWKEEEIL